MKRMITLSVLLASVCAYAVPYTVYIKNSMNEPVIVKGTAEGIDIHTNKSVTQDLPDLTTPIAENAGRYIDSEVAGDGSVDISIKQVSLVSSHVVEHYTDCSNNFMPNSSDFILLPIKDISGKITGIICQVATGVKR